MCHTTWWSDVTGGGNRDDDRILVYVHADKSCSLFHDPSPVRQARRQTIRRDPAHGGRVTPSGWPQHHRVKGAQLMLQTPTVRFQGLCPICVRFASPVSGLGGLQPGSTQPWQTDHNTHATTPSRTHRCIGLVQSHPCSSHCPAAVHSRCFGADVM
jgi:hypothetical protein